MHLSVDRDIFFIDYSITEMKSFYVLENLPTTGVRLVILVRFVTSFLRPLKSSTKKV